MIPYVKSEQEEWSGYRNWKVCENFFENNFFMAWGVFEPCKYSHIQI